MAKFKIDGMDQVENLLKELSNRTSIDKITKECVDEAAPTLADALRKNISSAANRKMKDRKTGARTGKKYSTGELARSIVPTKAKVNNYGTFSAITPVGTDKNGVRNAEKMAYLEYGTSKQEAHPVMQKSISEAEPQVNEIIQKRFEEWIDQVEKQ